VYKGKHPQMLRNYRACLRRISGTALKLQTVGRNALNNSVSKAICQITESAGEDNATRTPDRIIGKYSSVHLMTMSLHPLQV
jgi:hypothetical protein